MQLLDETLFHNANGCIGVRGALEEGYPEGFPTVRGTYINGVYDIVPMNQAEPLHGLVTEKQTMVNIADIQDIKLYVDGFLCTPFSDGFVAGERELDMEKGVTLRSIKWKSPQGKAVRLEVKRMASFIQLPLFLMTCRVETDADCELCFVASHRVDVSNFKDPNDPRVASESLKHIIVDRIAVNPTDRGSRSVITTHTAASKITVVTTVEDHIGNDGSECLIIHDDMIEELQPEAVTRRFPMKVKAGAKIRLTRYAACTDSLRFNNPAEAGADVIDNAVSEGAERLFAKQAEYVSSFWKDLDFEIDGDDSLSEALAFNLFQILQSAGKDGHCHMAAKGLSGEGYEGHYFWDTELYIQPFFTLTRPEISRNLLTYRYSILPQAKENARILGHKKGALFPWRTISGKECSGFFPAGSAQYHIDGAIAYAIVMYYLVTGDDDFMADMGLEMLLEIARLWHDLGNFHNGLFELHCVTGPDEYTCVVNNNYYTNMTAKHDLMWAVKYFCEFNRRGLAGAALRATGITQEELDSFLAAAEAMYLPYDEQLDITPQDDSFLSKKVWDFAATPKEDYPLLMHYHPLALYRCQVCKQADTILSYFLYQDEASVSTMNNSFRYYEKITTHDSSLSACIFSIMASRLGLADKAYDYFNNSMEIDLSNTHGNTKDGLHMANMGGSYLAIVFGFAGLHIKDEGAFLSPTIPEAWKGYRFNIKLRASMLHVQVNQKQVILRLQNPTAQAASTAMAPRLFLYGEPIEVSEVIKPFPLKPGLATALTF